MGALFIAANTVVVLGTIVPVTTRLTGFCLLCKRISLISAKSVYGSLRLVFSVFNEGVSTAVAEFIFLESISLHYFLLNFTKQHSLIKELIKCVFTTLHIYINIYSVRERDTISWIDMSAWNTFSNILC